MNPSLQHSGCSILFQHILYWTQTQKIAWIFATFVQFVVSYTFLLYILPRFCIVPLSTKRLLQYQTLQSFSYSTGQLDLYVISAHNTKQTNWMFIER